MTTKVNRSSAFYGRTDLVIHLQGFQLHETARLLRGRGFQEVLDAQCYTGGVPKYLELLAAAPSVVLGMEKEAFRADGYFVEEYDRIFVSHFGPNAEYPRLVRALADSPYGLNRRELAAEAEIAEGGMLSLRLHDLEAAGFISSHSPFDNLAMYRAKQQGRNTCIEYDRCFETDVADRLDVVSRLRRALDDGEFVLHFQPQYTADSRQLTGIEALVRWQHPEKGLLPPAHSFRSARSVG